MTSPLVSYQYLVLRCVPRVDRGEFTNVGVVIHSQAVDFLDCAFVVDPDRLRLLSPELDLGRLVRHWRRHAISAAISAKANRRPGAPCWIPSANASAGSLRPGARSSSPARSTAVSPGALLPSLGGS